MKLPITKSARQFGYVIWSSKTEPEVKKILDNRSEIAVSFNGFSIGVKSIDWKYHRISIGYKFTRALPINAAFYSLARNGEVLEVTTQDE